MQLFIDTANVEEIREAAGWGIIDGVTTNPTLIAREGRNFIEVVSQDAAGMLQEAGPLVKIHPNITIKIPMTLEGLKAVKALSSGGLIPCALQRSVSISPGVGPRARRYQMIQSAARSVKPGSAFSARICVRCMACSPRRWASGRES